MAECVLICSIVCVGPLYVPFAYLGNRPHQLLIAADVPELGWTSILSFVHISMGRWSQAFSRDALVIPDKTTAYSALVTPTGLCARRSMYVSEDPDRTAANGSADQASVPTAARRALMQTGAGTLSTSPGIHLHTLQQRHLQAA